MGMMVAWRWGVFSSMCSTHDTRFSSPNVSLSHDRLALIHWSSLPSRWSFIICSCVPVKMIRIALVWFLPTFRCRPAWFIRYWIASVLLATPRGNFISSRFRCVRFASALSGTYVLPFASFLSMCTTYRCHYHCHVVGGILHIEYYSFWFVC